jgi:hypothetical protein
LSRRKLYPNSDIEKVDVTGYEELERFFRRGTPDSPSYLPIPYQ